MNKCHVAVQRQRAVAEGSEFKDIGTPSQANDQQMASGTVTVPPSPYVRQTLGLSQAA